VYNDPFRLVTRGMTLWRCGMANSGTHNGGTFAHAACHLHDAYLDFVGGGHTRKDGTGGWHDAGDYNKYVTNANVTVGCMLLAWQQFGDRIRNVKLGVPESGKTRLPDYLAEVKWETDWLLKMQAPDGSVYHKLSTRNFGGFILPEKETAERYFTPWSSAATADFVAMLAQAARTMRPYDAAYANRCLQAATRSYQFLVAHPENHKADLTGFSTGTYETDDPDDRLWAVAEMWETTGETTYLRNFETRARALTPKIEAVWDWDNVRNLGMITYLRSKRPGRDAALVKDIRDSLSSTADSIVATRDAHGYARPFGTSYYWGANGAVARQSVILLTANEFAPKPAYVETALDALGNLLGRNVYGRSFVTGLGHNPPLKPHDRRSGGDNVAAPWPGYLVGGGHPKATDWRDDQDDYRTNEIAINWNGALIYALAGFVEPSGNGASRRP
jgi:endoglucanase